MPLVAVDRPEQCADFGRSGDRGEVLDLGDGDRTAKVGSHVLVAPDCRHAVAEHAAKDAAHPPGTLVGAGRLDFPQDRERLVGRDLGDRDVTDQRIGLR